MSKVLVGTLGVLGTASVAAPVAVTLSSGGGSQEESSNSPQQQLTKQEIKKTNWNKSIPQLSSAKDIKSLYGQVECLKKYESLTEEINNSGSPFFTGFGTRETKGCLTIEYQKQTFNNNKWSGEFKLVWSLVSNGEGVVTSIYARTKEGKLVVDSAAYLIEKTDTTNENKWNIKHAKENIEEETGNESELSKKLPKAGSAIDSSYHQDYWGFKPEFNNICKNGECNEEQGTIESKSVTWNVQLSNSGSHKITDWNSSFKTWFDKLFWENISHNFDNLKGTWIQQNQQ